MTELSSRNLKKVLDFALDITALQDTGSFTRHVTKAP